MRDGICNDCAAKDTQTALFDTNLEETVDNIHSINKPLGTPGVRPTLDTPVEVAPGKFKPLGDCTGEDLNAAAELLDAAAAENRKLADEAEAELKRRSETR